MPVRMQPCVHCGERNAPKYYDDDQILRCFICHKPAYGELRKYCSNCREMVFFRKTVKEHDVCVSCGQTVYGQAVPYITLNESEHEHSEQDDDRHDCKEISMIPAREIYKQNRGTSLWFIQALHDEFCDKWRTTQDREVKMQAWQYIKATTKLLKERNAWLFWKDLTPGTSEWAQWWKEHPEHQEDMAAYSNHRAAQPPEVALNGGLF